MHSQNRGCVLHSRECILKIEDPNAVLSASLNVESIENAFSRGSKRCLIIVQANPTRMKNVLYVYISCMLKIMSRISERIDMIRSRQAIDTYKTWWICVLLFSCAERQAMAMEGMATWKNSNLWKNRRL